MLPTPEELFRRAILAQDENRRLDRERAERLARVNYPDDLSTNPNLTQRPASCTLDFDPQEP